MNEALLKVEPGLKKYTNILELLHSVDVSESVDFRKAYNGFYRMRQRSDSIHSYPRKLLYFSPSIFTIPITKVWSSSVHSLY